jgi:hypothetical protein
MLIQEILQELFSPDFEPSPEDRWHKVDENHYDFYLDENRYRVSFTPVPGIGKTIEQIEFGLSRPGGVPMQWDLAKTGSSARVLELVAYTMRQHSMISPDLQGLFFTAKEPSRKKLYAVLANTLARETGWTVRPDLAAWMNPTKEQPFLIVDRKYAETVLEPAMNAGEPKPTPEPVRQPDTFGALPVRFD